MANHKLVQDLDPFDVILWEFNRHLVVAVIPQGFGDYKVKTMYKERGESYIKQGLILVGRNSKLALLGRAEPGSLAMLDG